ncbi:MAG: MCE family protein [Mycobacteriales bacterium]
MTRRTVSALIKLSVFAVVTILLTAVLAFTIGNVTFAQTTGYRADFTDVTGLNPGDDVRIAGVRVGSVTGVKIVHTTDAEVSFNVDSSIPLTVATQAQLRYLNLVGQRYLSLSPGVGSAAPLPAGGLIPLSQTQPALDLTVLFNGFEPLFQALTPADVNSLSLEIIQTLQGEGGTINSLLIHTASLTNALADRDAIIGQVINNLNVVLSTVEQHDTGLADVVDQLQALVTGLASDRQAIAGSLTGIETAAGQTASLLSQIRPPLQPDINALSAVAHTLATTTNGPGGPNTLDEYLQRFPSKLNAIIRTATYGSWFNFYLCDFVVPGTPIQYHVSTPSCGSQ